MLVARCLPLTQAAVQDSIGSQNHPLQAHLCIAFSAAFWALLGALQHLQCQTRWLQGGL